VDGLDAELTPSSVEGYDASFERRKAISSELADIEDMQRDLVARKAELHHEISNLELAQ
jgi:hypothetical protein